MINNKHLIVYDFETTGKNPNVCGITQIAAVIVHPRTLEIIAEFNRDNIKPRPDDILEDEAFKITRKDKDHIMKNGLDAKQAWSEFMNFVHQYNPKRSAWGAPIPCGFNTDAYDAVLLNRYCKDYGPWDDKKDQQTLVSNFMSYDLMRQFYWWLESTHEDQFPDIKLTTIAQYMGLPIGEAHDALVDTKNCAKIIIKMLRLKRKLFPQIKFKNAFANEN